MNTRHNFSYPASSAAVVFGVYLSAQSRLTGIDPDTSGQSAPLRVASYFMGKGKKSEDAENKQHFVCILCGDNFIMRRINTILDAQIAEKEKYVYLQLSKLANL